MLMHLPHHAMPPQMRTITWHLMCVAGNVVHVARVHCYGQVATPRALWSEILHLLRALLPTECLEVLSFQGPEVTVEHKARSSHAQAAVDDSLVHARADSTRERSCEIECSCSAIKDARRSSAAVSWLSRATFSVVSVTCDDAL